MFNPFADPSFWTRFLGGVAAGLLVPIILTSRRWYPRLKNYLSNAFSPKPTIDRFRAEILASLYKGAPDPGKHPRYYVRLNHKPGSGEAPTYHFFAKKEVVIQKFMAFLIPPLDFGHGQHNEDEGPEQRLGLEFDKNWQHYLTHIGEKAQESKAQKFRNKKFLFRHEEIPFEARRIIFFDRNLLRLFIAESAWIIENSHLQGTTFAPGWDGSPLVGLARSILLYVFDITKMHQITWTYRDSIQCIYLAKSQVASSQYYDFGYYLVEGIPIIYNPIYKKNTHKSIVEEKIFIGDSSRQLWGIREYVADFEDLWEVASAGQTRQRAWQSEFSNRYRVENPSDAYFRLESLSPHFFHEGYYKRLGDILADAGVPIYEQESLPRPQAG